MMILTRRDLSQTLSDFRGTLRIFARTELSIFILTTLMNLILATIVQGTGSVLANEFIGGNKISLFTAMKRVRSKLLVLFGFYCLMLLWLYIVSSAIYFVLVMPLGWLIRTLFEFVTAKHLHWFALATGLIVMAFVYARLAFVLPLIVVKGWRRGQEHPFFISRKLMRPHFWDGFIVSILCFVPAWIFQSQILLPLTSVIRFQTNSAEMIDYMIRIGFGWCVQMLYIFWAIIVTAFYKRI